MWNPYLRKLRWVQPRDKFYPRDMYGVGYENNKTNRNHKILRLLDVTNAQNSVPFTKSTILTQIHGGSSMSIKAAAI